MGAKIDIEIPGLAKLIRNLANFDRMWTEEMEKAGKQGGALLMREWKVEAPVDKGIYRSKITAQTTSIVGREVTTRVGTNVTSDGGFLYPKQLEEESGYHYASGPRKGQPLQGRVKAILARNEDKLNALIKQAGERLLDRMVVK